MGSIIIIAHDISIHAPPRGATGEPCAAAGRGAISIHAPPRGATLARMAGFQRRWYFNSRPSARGDKMLRNRMNWNIISIHAPPRGATPPVLRMAGNTSDVFQFTPLREGRPELRIVKQRTYAFQFTPLREGRPVRPPEVYAPHYFNSRPSARGDPSDLPKFTLRTISIHAPPRGATRFPRGAMWRFGSFQFTPLREGRRCLTLSIAPALAFQFTPLREGRHAPTDDDFSAYYFNSRPSARGDVVIAQCSHHSAISIHAPPRGATPNVIYINTACTHFNSRPSARGDGFGAQRIHRMLFQFTPLREGRRFSR